MKSKKLLSILLAGVMVLSMAACGEEGSEGTDGTVQQQPENTQVTESSIDFEDGQSAFVMMSTKARKADDSNVSVKDFNGSKALYVENVAGGEMYIGIDVDALLGDKVTEVASIQMDIGTQYADGSFSASAGNLYAYTGESLTENKLDAWSVYMENKNPKTVTFALKDGDGNPISFTAGNNNYIMLVKDDDTGVVPASMYLDNIAFIDANGNVLDADTSAVMEEPFEGYRRVVEEEEPETPAVNSTTVVLDDAYKGDWGQTTTIGADVLSAFAGQDITVTYKFELEGGYDYWLWCPMDAAWTKLGSAMTGLPEKSAADEGDLYHMQADGFIVIDDTANNTLTFTVKAADLDAIIAAGGLSGQTYGVTTFEATVAGAAGGAAPTEKVTLDDAYKGDWGQTTTIGADVLSKYAGADLTVTYKFELESGYDYWLWAPMDAAWTKLGSAMTGLPEKSAADEGDKYHMQADGFIVIDDTANAELTFTIKAADLDAIIAAGGLSGQTYGVTTFEVVLTGAAASAAAPTEKIALEDAYVGDWGQTTTIGADVLSKYAGADLTVTYKFELEGGYDYWLWAPMDAAWTKLGSAMTGLPEKSAADEGDKYHMQADGFIVIDDTANAELTFTIKAADLDAIIAAGGLSGQTYGVTTYEVVLAGAAPAAPAAATKVALDESYVGDWGQTTVIGADVLSAFAGKDVTVTFSFELEGGYDYYLWAPMDAAWTKLGSAMTGLPEKSAADEGDLYHMQADGFMVIDDQTNTEITFTIKAADLDTIIAAGGLSGQTYGVTVYEAKIQ